jgi:hypothetical protein
LPGQSFFSLVFLYFVSVPEQRAKKFGFGSEFDFGLFFLLSVLARPVFSPRLSSEAKPFDTARMASRFFAVSSPETPPFAEKVRGNLFFGANRPTRPPKSWLVVVRGAKREHKTHIPGEMSEA